MLTRKQFELLRFIHERLTETGVPPSFDEMKDALDLRSKSGIHRLITALEERGFIRRLANRARAIEVIKLPESVAHGMSGRSRGFVPSVIEGDLGRVRQIPAEADEAVAGSQTIAVPVMGRIAAGTPIEAIQTRSHTINLPSDMLSNRRAPRGRNARQRPACRPAGARRATSAGSPRWARRRRCAPSSARPPPRRWAAPGAAAGA